MKEIEQIYVNDTGMAFFWKSNQVVISEKVQLVFKETGFYFSLDELQQFNNLIEASCLENDSCESCELRNHCHKFLLKTPVSQIDLAVSMQELSGIKDLVQGTLFKLELLKYISGAGMN